MLYRILLTTRNALLSIAVCLARDALLGIVSIYKAGHTYTGQINQARKCFYLKQGIRRTASVASPLTQILLICAFCFGFAMTRKDHML